MKSAFSQVSRITVLRAFFFGMIRTRGLYRFKMLEFALVAFWTLATSELIRTKLLFHIDFVAVGQRSKASRDRSTEIGMKPIRTEVLQRTFIRDKAGARIVGTCLRMDKLILGQRLEIALTCSSSDSLLLHKALGSLPSDPQISFV